MALADYVISTDLRTRDIQKLLKTKITHFDRKLSAVEASTRAILRLMVKSRDKGAPPNGKMEAMLHSCGITFVEIGILVGCSPSSAARRAKQWMDKHTK